MSTQPGQPDLLTAEVADRRGFRDRFIYELLLSNASEDADLLHRADIMGMDLSRPRAVILLDAGIQSTRPRSASSSAVISRP